MVEERYRFADQGNRRLVEPSVQGDGPVLVHLPGYPFPEVIISSLGASLMQWR